ncbi:MAG: hypothetical protein M1834_001728 [Cirrosporium novae-zelandiae]|nr:MAG: hypothetical protein M1834_001728 [Cirrosporium novae-zelandiae]
MEDVGLQQFAPSAFRATHPTALQQFPHTYPSATLASHLGADFEDHALQGFSAADLSDLSAAPQLQQPSFQPRPVPPHPPQHPPSRAPPQINSHHQQPSGHNGYKQPGGGLFGVLTPRPGRAPLSYQPPLSQASIQNQIQIHNQIPNQSQPQHNAIARLQAEQQQEFSAPGPVDQTPEKVDSHFSNLKLIQNPPNLQEWREKLFHVDDTIVLSEDEFNTYFPHVDNVYSHRSTQRYKRKPFISHYWDCRLKGRPPGTPKSDDPTKKKRKRTARERDLCDVKIKITEYFPVMSPEYAAAVQSGPVDGNPASNFFAPDQIGAPATGQPQILGVLAPGGNLPPGHPGATGARYYTIQRVNGNGANGKADGTAGPHKHTLDESDRVKKNSVQRHFMKEEKEKRKTQVRDILVFGFVSRDWV